MSWKEIVVSSVFDGSESCGCSDGWSCSFCIRGTVSEISDTKDEIGFHKTFRVSNEKIRKAKLSQDETALAIKLTHRAGNPENNKLESELVGYPFLIGLKTPLTCEGLYCEVYVFFLFWV